MRLQRFGWMFCFCLAMFTATVMAAKKSGSGSKKSTPPPPAQETTPPPPPADTTPTTKPSTDLAAAVDLAAKKVTTAFEQTPEWTTAATAETNARADYDAAKTAAVAKLKNDPKYAAAAAASDKAQKDIETLRTNGGSPDDLSKAADQAMRTRSVVSQMQMDSTSTDPTLVAAKAKLSAATGAMNTLRKQEHEAVLADPDWQAAKKAYDDSHVKTANK